MGVCCIVFDFDGMLFDFFMNFLNIEKNKILRILFSIFCFLRGLCYFQHKKNGVKKFPFSFRTVTRKRMDVFSRNFAGTCTMSWGCDV